MGRARLRTQLRMEQQSYRHSKVESIAFGRLQLCLLALAGTKGDRDTEGDGRLGDNGYWWEAWVRRERGGWCGGVMGRLA